MNCKILLLNSNYTVLHFIPERHAIKLIFKGKAEILSAWKDQYILFGKDVIDYPAIIKMNYYVHKKLKTEWTYSRKAVFRRDLYHCQFCNEALKPGQITVDHLLPKCLGGESSFLNCVAACHPCNSKKAYKTLEQSGLKLIRNPAIPHGILNHYPDTDIWHEDWLIYIKK